MSGRFYLACALSGCVWAVIALLIGWMAMGSIIWGGVFAAPLIGIVVGRLYRPAYRFSAPGRGLAALLSLYVAVVLFGLAVGLYDAATGSGARKQGAVVLQAVLATLWGVTFTGYFLFLWPLAYMTHDLVERWVERR